MNRFAEVSIFNYVTEQSFDVYIWQTLESKARFIAQIMSGNVTARTAEDVDDMVITAAQVKAIATGNPQILEKVSVEVELSRLSRLYTVCLNPRGALYRNRTLLSTIAPSRSESEFQAILNLERIRRVAGRAESQDRIGRLAQIYPSMSTPRS
jgi:hypothetical protein